MNEGTGIRIPLRHVRISSDGDDIFKFEDPTEATYETKNCKEP